MATRAKKKRTGARRSSSSSATTAGARQLPPVAMLEASAPRTDEALAAVKALELEDRLEAAEEEAKTQWGAGGDGDDGDSSSPATGRADATAPKPDSTREPSAASSSPAPAAAPPAPKSPRPAKRSITGNQYNALDRKQLRTALAIAENKNDELESRLKDVLPLAAVQQSIALERATGVVISAIFDVAAIAVQVDDVRLDADEEKELGELGAPAVAPYLGQWAQHVPLAAFLAKLTTIATTKALIAKAVREEARKKQGAVE